MPISEPMTASVVVTTLTDANTEYNVSLAGAKYFTVQCRTSAEVIFGFTVGSVDTASPPGPYATLKADSAYNSPEKVAVDADTIYLASTTAGVVVEIIKYQGT